MGKMEEELLGKAQITVTDCQEGLRGGLRTSRSKKSGRRKEHRGLSWQRGFSCYMSEQA